MDGSQNGERRLVLVHSQLERPAGQAKGPGEEGRSRKQYDYLADMIRQLQVLAWQTDCSTLASILEIAYREVDSKRRAVAPKRRSWEPVL